MLRTLLALLLLSPMLLSAQVPTLTIDRLYEEPTLSGTPPRSLKVSPDGQRVTFLRAKDDDQNALDLWEYHVPSGQTRLLVDAKAITGGVEEVLSDEEKARRERLRIAGISGIVDYHFSDDGQKLLFPLAGSLYVYDLKAPADSAVRELTRASDGFATDPKFSPKSGHVSFVRDRALFVVPVAGGDARRVSPEATATVSFGMAEFVAQEEMNRLTGYWWAPDDSAIAYARVDEAPVAVERRFEIYADRTEVIEQRYPAAGKANALVELYVAPLAGDEPVKVDLGANSDIYLARVNWADKDTLLVQRQSRDQRTLDLLKAQASDGSASILLSETSDTWVNLHDDLNVLPDGKGFIWSSERDGYAHLELRSMDGALIRPLTRGPWVVDKVLALDAKRRRVYFSANAGEIRDAHVFVTSLDTADPGSVRRLTAVDGWYDATFSRDARVFVAAFSTPNLPPQVRLYDAEGKTLATLFANELKEGHPYHPFKQAHRQPEFGTLEAEDGQTLHYRLIKPLDFDPSKKYPVVVRVYGGPHVQYVQRRWDERWGLFDQVLAQRGFVVFSLDNRGSARRGVAFESPLFRRMGSVEVDDQMVGVRWLATQDFVDAKRIGAFGWSYGGYMTLMMLAKHSDEIAAGVSVAPVSDWKLYDTHYTERYMDHPAQHADAYQAASVLTHTAGLRSPLFLIHGMADDNVLFTHSTMLMADLQNRGTAFDLMTYPGGKHGLAGTPTRKHVFNAIVAWFERRLKNAEMKNPT